LPSPQFMVARRSRLHPYIRTVDATSVAVPDGMSWLGSHRFYVLDGTADIAELTNHGLTCFAITS